MRKVFAAWWLAVVVAGARARKRAAELLTAVAVLAGWAFLTSAVAALTSPLAWRFSIGVLCLSLAGWKFIYQLASSGLYALSRARVR